MGEVRVGVFDSIFVLTMRKLAEFLLNFKYAFRPRKPRLVLRLALALFQSKVLNRPPLRYVDFAIDFTCNLHCEHCFATALRQPGRRRMTIEDYSRVGRECMELGTVNFSFQGGEPLLCSGLGGIIKACRPEKNVISVSTNGTLLTRDRLVELRKWGVDILTVSLDSGIPSEHNRFRGASPGTFEKILQGIKTALQEGLHVTLGTVVTHQTLKSQGITALVNLTRELKTVLYFIFPVPAGRWLSHNDMLLTPDDLSYIDQLTHQSPYLRTDFQANLGSYGCGAVKEILYLTPYGDVLPCPFLHISLGNIFQEPLAVIRDRALENPYFRGYHQKCLASTDQEFIQRYLSQTFEAKALPLQWDAVFSHKNSPPIGY